MDRKLRFGIIGCGTRGRLAFGALLKDRDDCEICALYDTNKVRLHSVSEQIGGKIYTDLEEMLEKESLDCVIVTSPDTEHEKGAIAALNHGVNVLIDKPLATSAAGCRNIIDAMNKSGKIAMIGFNLRHHPVLKRMKQIIDNGDLGKIFLIENREFYDGGSSIKDAGFREKTELGIKKILGQVQQPGANDVGKLIDGKSSTVGVNMQDSQPYPDDNAHKKLKPVFNAIRKSEDEFIQCITPKGNGKKNQEFIGIYDQNGKPYWVGMGPKGKGAANFPEIPEGCTLIHNHPEGRPFSTQDVKEFVERKMSRMVVSVQHEDGKIGKFTLTKKKTGDTLTVQEIKRRFDNAIGTNNSEFEAWKEALNGTCYEIRDS